MMKAQRSKKHAILASLKWGEGWSRCPINFVQDLGQYKMEQLSPIPLKAMMKVRRSKTRTILASLKWGEGCSRCPINFVQDCGNTDIFPAVAALKICILQNQPEVGGGLLKIELLARGAAKISSFEIQYLHPSPLSY